VDDSRDVLSIDLKQRHQLARLMLDSRGSDGDYPRGYELAVSDDGKRWSAPILSGVGKGPLIEIQLPPGTITQHIRITQTGQAENYWSIHGITLHGSLRP
jgi:hypothetical protein